VFVQAGKKSKRGNLGGGEDGDEGGRKVYKRCESFFTLFAPLQSQRFGDVDPGAEEPMEVRSRCVLKDSTLHGKPVLKGSTLKIGTRELRSPQR
jgi:hypothetical protein